VSIAPVSESSDSTGQATGVSRVLGLIPARGGSKGVRRKNIAPLCGKPLLQYTADAALGSERLSRVVLSTDDAEIAETARRLGVEVPFMRPAVLAQDDTPMLPVILHALDELSRSGESYEAVCLLQPTSPLRAASDIDAAVALLERTGADSVISFVDAGEHHPSRMKFLDATGRVVDPPFGEPVEGLRRQELPKLYLREGSIYLSRTRTLREKHSIKGDDCRALLMPEERVCNIDTPFDLFLAEQLLLNYADWRQRQGADGG